MFFFQNPLYSGVGEWCGEHKQLHAFPYSGNYGPFALVTFRDPLGPFFIAHPSHFLLPGIAVPL